MQLDEVLLAPCSPKHRGVHAHVARNEPLEAALHERYGRWGLCLKVFKGRADDPASFRWGKHGTLGEHSRVQNLYARAGLAPRVYDLILLPDGRPAQVTGFVEEGDGAVDRQKEARVRARHGVKASWDMNPNHFPDGQIVDFQGFRLADPAAYEKRLVDLAHEHAAWGSRGDPYHSVPELGIAGQRDNASRFAMLDTDWRGRTVLDLGCNLGMDAALALRAGARRVTGVDLPRVVPVAFEVTNWVGAWNLDLVAARLPAERDGLEPHDVVLALSCKQTRPFPWAFDLCREVMFVEGHVPEKDHHYRPLLEEHFREVTHLGTTRDHGPRPLFRCRR